MAQDPSRAGGAIAPVNLQGRTTMSIRFSRTPIILVWLVVFTLFAWSGWPMPVDMAMLTLIVGAAVPVIIFILSKETPPSRRGAAAP
jgi:uncharacterized YccA/Bax inhibitor family protein